MLLRKLNSRSRAKKAFTLVEVLVAMLVLAIGLLGLAGITVVVMRSNVLSQQISEATTITTDLMERIKQVPFDALPNCGDGNELATTCAIITESGLESRGDLFLPPAGGSIATCKITDPGGNAQANPIANDGVFDRVTANLVATAAGGTDFCTAFNNLPRGQYIRYYRIFAPAGSTNQRTIIVVTLWRDRFGKWRHIQIPTSRSRSGS